MPTPEMVSEHRAADERYDTAQLGVFGDDAENVLDLTVTLDAATGSP